MFTKHLPTHAEVLDRGDNFSRRMHVGHSCPTGLRQPWKSIPPENQVLTQHGSCESLFCPANSGFLLSMRLSEDFTSPISASFAMKRVLKDLSNRVADKQGSEAAADR